MSPAALTGAGLRVGIIGGGFMGEVHTRAARAVGADVVGVASSTPESAARAAARLGVATAHPSVDSLIADVDVVHVCTPNATHLEHAMAAISAGRHVVCEKPITTTVADGRMLKRAAEAAGVVVTVPFAYRYHPLAREARARVAAGEAGRLFSIQGSYLQDWLLEPGDDDWRADGALGGRSRAFADIGSHLVDLIEFVAGEPITRLSASTRTVHPERGSGRPITTEDVVAVVAETGSGALVSLLVSQVAAGRKNALVVELHGASETLRFEQENPETLWVGRRAGSIQVARDPAALHPDAARISSIPAGHPLGYQDAFTAFAGDTYSAVRGQRPSGLPDVADGLRAVEITAAVLESARTGQWTRVDSRTREDASVHADLPLHRAG